MLKQTAPKQSPTYALTTLIFNYMYLIGEQNALAHIGKINFDNMSPMMFTFIQNLLPFLQYRGDIEQARDFISQQQLKYLDVYTAAEQTEVSAATKQQLNEVGESLSKVSADFFKQKEEFDSSLTSQEDMLKTEAQKFFNLQEQHAEQIAAQLAQEGVILSADLKKQLAQQLSQRKDVDSVIQEILQKFLEQE